MKPTSHDANQAMNIKAEEVSDAEEEEDPMSVTFQEIKAEPEVSCMSLYARGVGYKDVVEAVLPCQMQPKYFCQFSISKKYFILQNINQSKNIYYI
jgi:hypothetical protein